MRFNCVICRGTHSGELLYASNKIMQKYGLVNALWKDEVCDSHKKEFEKIEKRKRKSARMHFTINSIFGDMVQVEFIPSLPNGDPDYKAKRIHINFTEKSARAFTIQLVNEASKIRRREDFYDYCYSEDDL